MPVVHLLVLGALVALLVAVVKGPPVDRDDAKRVVISDADVAQVRAKWIRTWNRPPTALELREALGKHVREEVLYHEALARGLDRQDPTVRLAMVRKLTMLGAAATDAAEVTDEEAQAYFALRQERYRVPATVSFMHVYFNPDQSGDEAKKNAEKILADLRQRDPRPEQLDELGDPLMLQSVYAEVSEEGIRRAFGAEFAQAVMALPADEWEGPIESGYGVHFVKVFGRKESRLPEFGEVSHEVLNDMLYEARRAAEDQFYQEVAAGFQVVYGEAAAQILEGAEQ